MSLKPCKFFIGNSKTPLDSNQMMEYIYNNPELLIPKEEVRKTKETKRISDKIRSFADKNQKKFYDEDGNEMQIFTQGMSQKDFLYLIADIFDGLSNIADSAARLRESIRQAVAKLGLPAQQSKLVEEQTFNQLKNEKEFTRGNRQSKVVNRLLSGGSLSNEIENEMRKNGEEGGFTFDEQSVNIEETQSLIGDLYDSLLDDLGQQGADAKMMEVAQASNLPSWFRVLVAGKMNDQFYLDERSAETEFEKQIARDKAIAMMKVIADIGENAGRTLRFIQEVYKQSPIAYEQYVKEKIDLGLVGDKQHTKNQEIAEEVAKVINEPVEPSVVAESVEQVFDNEPKTAEDLLHSLVEELDDIDAEIAAIEREIKASKKKGNRSGAANAADNTIRSIPDLQAKLDELKAKKKATQNKIKELKSKPKAGPKANTKTTELEKLIGKAKTLTSEIGKAKDQGRTKDAETLQKEKDLTSNTITSLAKSLGAANTLELDNLAKKATNLTNEIGKAKKEGRTKDAETLEKEKDLTTNNIANLAKSLNVASSSELDNLTKKAASLTNEIGKAKKEGRVKDAETLQKEKDLTGNNITNLAKSLNVAKTSELENLTKKAVNLTNDIGKAKREGRTKDAETLQKEKDLTEGKTDDLVKAILDRNSDTKEKVKKALIDAGYSKTVGGKEVVNWDAVVGNSNSTEAAKQAIFDKIKETSGEAAANAIMPEVNAAFAQMVAEKKVSAINKILKAQGKPPITNKTQASIAGKVLKLVGLNGSANGTNIQSAIGTIIGTTAITPTQSNIINELSNNYFNSQPGFERAQQLERMTNYINRISKGRAYYAIASLHQHYIAGLISGPLTSIKNSTVALDLVRQVLQEYARSGFDNKTLKVALASLKEGLTIGKTVVKEGFAGRTLAMLDIEAKGSEKINPRLSEFRSDIFDSKTGQVLAEIYDVAKYVMRLNEGVDSVFGTVSSNTLKYNLLKGEYQRQGLNKKDAGTKAFQDLFVTPQMLQDATIKAQKEYQKLGISPSESRVKRRAYEIIDSERNIDELIKLYGEEAANQITYKKAGIYGFTNLLSGTLNGVTSKLNLWTESKEGSSKSKAILSESAKFLLNQIAPFANIGSNVIESSLDWTPYGTVKTLGAAVRYKLISDKDGKTAVRLKIALREATAKQAIMLTTLAVVGAMYLAGDDDDEEEILKSFDFVKGTGGKYVYKNTMPTTTKLRTVGGLTSDLYGSLGNALLLMKDFKDNVDKNPDGDYVSILKAAVDAYKSAALSNSILAGITQLSNTLGDLTGGSAANYLQKKSASLLVSSTLPATGAAKQVGDIVSPMKKENVSYWDYLANEGGAYTTWTIDKPKFDWRGRVYATGDLYASNLRAITGKMGITKDILTPDAIDVWAEEKGVKTITPKTEFGDQQLDRGKFTVLTSNGVRNMDGNENYEFRKNASIIFDKKLNLLWEDKEDKLKLKSLTSEQAKEVVNSIWNESKIESMYKLNKNIDSEAMKDYDTVKKYKNRFEDIKAVDANAYDYELLKNKIKNLETTQ
jgi:hypothetical protein